jgi:hypothetical protein
MSWKWAGQTMAVAVATAALTVAAGMPLVVTAEAPKAEAVTVAKGVQSDCTVELVAGKLPYKPGEKPKLVLKITSNSSESAEIEATVLIEGMKIGSESSRMGPVSLGVLWKHSDTWLVLPGETEEFALPVDIRTPEKQSLRFRLLLGPQPAESAVRPAGPELGRRELVKRAPGALKTK